MSRSAQLELQQVPSPPSAAQLWPSVDAEQLSAAQRPPTHESPDMHGLPHQPQFCGSVWRSSQPSAQQRLVKPASRSQKAWCSPGPQTWPPAPEQRPPLQVSPEAQAQPHSPQFCGSVVRSAQVAPQPCAQQLPTAPSDAAHAPNGPWQLAGTHWWSTQVRPPEPQPVTLQSSQPASICALGSTAQVALPKMSPTHRPELQVVPHAPQFAGSWVRSTPAPLQQVPTPLVAPVAPNAQRAPLVPGAQLATKQACPRQI